MACASFSGDDTPVDGGDGAADAASESATVGEAGTDATVPCDETKLASDPAHCGKCGHSCLGGACVGGTCQPVVLATTMASFAYGPVLDSARAAIATHGTAAGSRVQWCPKAGCPGGLLGVDLPTVATGPRAIVSDANNTYVSTVGGNSAGVFRIDQGGLAHPITPIDGTFQNADQLALDGADVLFVSAYQADPIGIYRVPADGSAAATRIVPVLQSDRWAYLVSRPGRIYVGDYARIATCGAATCSALDEYASAAVAHQDITGMATDGTSLFWISDAVELLTCPLGASCPSPAVVLGTTSLEGSIPTALSIHGPDLYITTAAGKIFTCKAATCVSTFLTLATDEVVEGAAAADEQAVYWLGRDRVDAGSDAGTGLQTYRLMRLAK